MYWNIRFWIPFVWVGLVMFSESAVGEDYAEFRTTELQCVIGNNAAMGEHKAGYSGVFRLTSTHQPETLFVPSYVGLNLELFFDGASTGKNRAKLFEPRHAPMQFKKLDDRTAELYQPTTPIWKMESWTRFHLVDPHYIDVTFRCVPHEYVFQGGAFGVFWASYINAPLNKSLYFLQDTSSLEQPLWCQFCTQYHGRDSTVRYHADPFRWDFAPDMLPDFMFSVFSKITYAEPFYYGRFRNMVWIIIFPKPEGIRFTQSPSGGGPTQVGDDNNPAWDFQFIVPNYLVGKEYQMQYRAVYKPWVDREDVLKEVRLYRAGLR